MAFVDVLPTLNATLNGASAICIFAAWRAIRGGDAARHKRLMLTALGLSATFLVFYLIRAALTGAHRYPVDDWTKPVYLTVLATHTLLAAAVPFLVIRAVYLALKARFDAHRRIVRFALPIWGYVSVTGVVIYLMLYHLAPARAATPPLTSCAQHLGGLWDVVDDDGDPDPVRAFDVRDEGAALSLYPMWNTAGESSSPWRIELRRAGALVVGEVGYRVQTGKQLCWVRQPASLQGCAGDRARLELTLADADPGDCASVDKRPLTLALRRRR